LVLGSVLLALICCTAIVFGQSGKRLEANENLSKSSTLAEVRKFISDVEAQSLPEVEHDGEGWPRSLTLRGRYACDRSLVLASYASSLRSLTIQGTNTATACTERGVASLETLTNLTTLKILCTGPLQAGFFKGICQLRNLRELQLTAALPPSQEYLCLSKLNELRRLGIAHCTNFGDVEVGVLTNLTKLEALELVKNRVSYRGTNVLKSLPHLRDVVFIK
jgi:hypothetical protein